MSELAKVPFLAKLDAADLEALARRMEKRTYEMGDIVYADGTPGDGLYYVQAGAVAVVTSASCDGEIMAHLPKGSTFGESALLNDHPRSSAVRAATDCTLMVLTRASFQAFLAENPNAGQTMTQTLLQRPPRSSRQLVSDVLKPMPLFARLPDDALTAIARKLQPNSFCANSLVFSAGQAPDALYLVESGIVRLLAGENVLAEIGAHDFFGEDALLTDQPREVTALTANAANVWALARSDFDALVAQHPAAVLSLTRALAARSEQWNRKLLALTATAPVVSQPVAVPMRVAAPAPARPAVRRQPLVAGLSMWVGNLSLSGKLRLALLALLVAWLLLVSLPTAIAGTLSGSSSNGSLLGTRNMALVQSSRGGAVVRGPEAAPIAAVVSTEALPDVADAPMTHLNDLVIVAKPTAIVLAAPATVEPTKAVAAATATPAPLVKYTIRAGDTLGEIAARFNVDLDVLAEANAIDNPALINVDQELVIPGGEEQEAIAAKLAAEPRPTAAPAPAVALRAAAAPVAPAAPAPSQPPAVQMVWDGRLDKHNIRVEQAGVGEGQQYYRLVKALFRDTNENVGPNMPNGDHNIYIEVLDENGKRLVGAKALIRNGGTATLTIENKPFPEYGSNFPMYGMLGSYSAWVDGLPSDKVVGMGLPMKWHVSYFLTFQRTTK